MEDVFDSDKVSQIEEDTHILKVVVADQEKEITTNEDEKKERENENENENTDNEHNKDVGLININ